jgi:hypothetical protein
MNDIYSGEGGRRSWRQMITSCSGTATDRRNQYWFVGWLFAWAISFLASTAALTSDHGFSTQVAWTMAAAPNLFSVLAILAYLRFLRMADELMQKIQLDGLAIGFGTSVVFVMGYQLFEHAGAPHLEINDLLMVMMISWVAGQLYSIGKYR